METIWLVVGLIAGSTTIFLFLRPRMLKAEADAIAERTRHEETEQKRQQLEIDLATARVEAQRSRDLSEKVGAANQTITDLEKKCSSMSTSLEERERALADEREQ